jgi:hypothetical protein
MAPEGGAPAIMPAGMLGDRAVAIFIFARGDREIH